MAAAKRFRKAVILGAGGFIGINLAAALSKMGFELVCFDRHDSAHWPVGAMRIIGDFSAPPQQLFQELDEALVFHLVSSCKPSQSTLMLSDEINKDLLSTINALERTREKQLRWVFLSSGGTVYGQPELEIIAENCTTTPICSYGIIKLTIERYFHLYRTLYGTEFIVLRLANPYGPWQHPLRGQGVISMLIYKALTGQEVEIWGDGTNTRDYIHIGDAVAGIISAALEAPCGEAYNIGSSTGQDINHLIELVSNIMKRNLKVTHLPARSVDVKRNVLCTEKLRKYSAWSPEINIQQGIEITGAWLNKHIDLW